MRAIPLLLLGGWLCGCGASGDGPLQLSWRFVDGRHCVDTGATAVTVAAPSLTFACSAGDAPASVTVDHAPRAGSLRVVALSPQMNELYRGELPLDAALLPGTVTLYATGAR